MRPGLYVLVREDVDGPRIAGFWVLCGSDYLRTGPLGPPEREPPFAGDLLEAATEVVWWQTLDVTLSADGAWRPLIVVEWPPHLAFRASVPPPGVPRPKTVRRALSNEERAERGWMVLPSDAGGAPGVEDTDLMDADELSDPYEALREQSDRSLVMVVRGQLQHDGRMHTGSFFLVQPVLLDEGEVTVEPLEAELWLDRLDEFDVEDAEVVEGEQATQHELGPRPLELFGQSVGFHSSGWLTRNLSIWPLRPDDIEPGVLPYRDVQMKWVAQGQLALSSAASVAAVVFLFTFLVGWLATPVKQTAEPPPEPAPQPALSVCSADYQDFVDELRCQLDAMASGISEYNPDPTLRAAQVRDVLNTAVCTDAIPAGAATMSQPAPEDIGEVDLQPVFCGLLDRIDDGGGIRFGESEVAPADFAAAQACFNVLGRPYPYRLTAADAASMGVGDQRMLGDARLFLEDEALGIGPLREALLQLHGICEAYRDRTEHRTEGAIFATHVAGVRDTRKSMGRTDKMDANRPLRGLLRRKVLVNTSAINQTCFIKGERSGTDFEHYEDVCIDADDRDAAVGFTPSDPKMERLAEASKLWATLRAPEVWRPRRGDSRRVVDELEGSRAPSGVVEAYFTSRFGQRPMGRGRGAGVRGPSLWACHDQLTDGTVRSGEANGLWQTTYRVPEIYAVSGSLALDEQLIFDAAFRSFLGQDDGGGSGAYDGGVCWQVVFKSASAYTPVHPLLSEVEPDGWPAMDQQICGQVCAAYYKVGNSLNDEDWVTGGSDLRACVQNNAYPENWGAVGDRGFDRLAIPWHGRGDQPGEVRTVTSENYEGFLAHTCAYNVVAQSLIPMPEGSEEGFVVQDRTGQQFGGETASGSRVVGGREGLPTRYIEGLINPYGEGVGSVAACGHVATQCLTGVLLEVTGDGSVESYRWLPEWRKQIEALSSLQRSDLRRSNPWCEGVQDYLVPKAETAQLDTPCVAGVDKARVRVETAIREMERLYAGGGR